MKVGQNVQVFIGGVPAAGIIGGLVPDDETKAHILVFPLFDSPRWLPNVVRGREDGQFELVSAIRSEKETNWNVTNQVDVVSDTNQSE